MIHRRSYELLKSSWENKAWKKKKKFRLGRDSKPWPLRYRCSSNIWISYIHSICWNIILKNIASWFFFSFWSNLKGKFARLTIKILNIATKVFIASKCQFHLKRENEAIFKLNFFHFVLVLAETGGYSQWSSWTECSSTCGVGLRSRNRSCTNPPPVPYGKGCSHLGNNNHTVECNSGVDCPHLGNSINKTENCSSQENCDLLENNTQTAECNNSSCTGRNFWASAVSSLDSQSTLTVT